MSIVAHKPTCKEPECHRVVRRRGLCKAHYQSALKDGSLPRLRTPANNGALCAAPNCDRTTWSETGGGAKQSLVKGLCSTHFYQMRRARATDVSSFEFDAYLNTSLQRDKICSFHDCDREAYGKDLCKSHYGQLRRGTVLTSFKMCEICSIPGCESPGGKGKELCQKHRRYAATYGISWDALKDLFQAENRVCGNPACGSTERLHLDHDHSCCPYGGVGDKKSQVSCGECIRGWLCDNCNRGLGCFFDDPRKLEGIVSYLETYK